MTIKFGGLNKYNWMLVHRQKHGGSLQEALEAWKAHEMKKVFRRKRTSSQIMLATARRRLKIVEAELTQIAVLMDIAHKYNIKTLSLALDQTYEVVEARVRHWKEVIRRRGNKHE